MTFLAEERYFDTPDWFWALPMAAIAEAKTRYPAQGWSEVFIQQVAGHFRSYDFVDAAKDDGVKFDASIANDGEVPFHEVPFIEPRKRASGGICKMETRPKIDGSVGLASVLPAM